MSEAKCLVSVGAVVLREGQILVNRRVLGRDPGHWRIPSGFPELNESFSKAAVREVEEETKVKTSCEGASCRSRYDLRQSGRTMPRDSSGLKLNWISGEPIPDGVETDAAEFVSLEEFRRREDLSSVYVSILEKSLNNGECLRETSSLRTRPDIHLNNAFL